MTKTEVNRIRSLIDEENDGFVIVTNSQMAICNTPSTPIIFDDAKECIYHFKRTNRDGSVPSKERRMEVYVTQYDSIESIDVLKTYDEMIELAVNLGINQNGINRIKDAFKRNHIGYKENVIK